MVPQPPADPLFTEPPACEECSILERPLGVSLPKVAQQKGDRERPPSEIKKALFLVTKSSLSRTKALTSTDACTSRVHNAELTMRCKRSRAGVGMHVRETDGRNGILIRNWTFPTNNKHVLRIFRLDRLPTNPLAVGKRFRATSGHHLAIHHDSRGFLTTRPKDGEALFTKVR